MKKTMNQSSLAGKSSWVPWMMLPIRTVLFVLFQVMFFGIYLLFGNAKAWDSSAAWWPFTVTFANIVCIVLLTCLFRREGKSFLSLFRFSREHIKKDLLTLLWVLAIALPVAFLPNILLATWLFGDMNSAMSLFIRHLPTWAALIGFILFPITQGVAELVTYFLFIEPRLEEQIKIKWLAVSITALALGIQHIAIPLIFDGRFIVWRMLMFIPFAFLLGIVLRWKPRLLPYLAIVHILMDMATAAMLFTA